MFGIGDNIVFTEFEEAEMQKPSPRKEDADGRIVYVSRELEMPKEWGAPVLCDFGSAVIGSETHLEDVQPNIYRAPEVILEVPWSYSIDIWNLGCVVSHRILTLSAALLEFMLTNHYTGLGYISRRAPFHRERSRTQHLS